MERIEVFNAVKQAVIERLGVSEDQVVEEAEFVKDLGADSLYLVDIVMELEEKFKIRVEDSDFEKLKTIKNAVDYIFQKLG
ncbi:MAG: Acyl carrier protein [candidate division WS2 bacterium]|uniref:Acyl carrier protein n=1 Tax=Psychracetigena formicireducens TaxID=2986056 RepID=A0A9E2BJ10_PSYF1|nr:Acyl carrier protein [Candidatus Psychracetigena formicireducens]MBT9145105.1 Acyl carrier protein [Candidatus Psychracetigena formicireducens]MBT9150287.1 Acyl carrier protein [Candidatus Psychracetigena formicireducens]